jgi:ribosomal protein S18 acetylase RimI-like enzyme
MKYPFTKSGDSGFHFQPITVADKEFADMFTAFLNDYGKLDNISPNGAEWQEGDTLDKAFTYKVINDGKTVGFFERAKIEGALSTYAIENVYVKPEYRGCGVATRIYQHAIHNYECKVMSLSWQRVNTLAQIDTYLAAGFKGLMIEPGQVGTARGLCALVTEPVHSPLYFELDKKSIMRARNHSQKICEKLTRKMGGVARGTLTSLPTYTVDVVNEVIYNHFGNRMKQYLGA